MPFFTDDFIGGTMAMNAEEIGAYLLLLIHQWNSGEIDGDDASLAQLARCSPARLKRVLAKFERSKSGGYMNKRLEQVRNERIAYIQRQVENGKKGGSLKRAYTHRLSEPQSSLEPNHTHSNSNSNSNSIPTANPNSNERESGIVNNPPTLTQCIEASSTIGMQADEVEAFHAYYDSQGWRKANGQPVTNLRSALQNWKIRQQTHAKQNNERPKATIS